jgi:UPF0271 protein
MTKSVDINCDLGEGETLADCHKDAALMPFLTRCNIACGGHAGNELTMLETLKQAQAHQVLAGAHPGYQDRENFGRVSIKQALSTTLNHLLEQVNTLNNLATEIDIPLHHLKLHGALYNDAEQSAQLASAICQTLAKHYPHLTLVGLSQGAMQHAARTHGLAFLAEGFIDRAYLLSGHLTPRKHKGSVYSELTPCINQLLAMVSGQPIPAFDGTANQPSVLIKADTFCLHGDSQLALPLATQLQSSLHAKGFKIQ